MKKIKLIISIVLSIIPLNFLKLWGYRLFLNYKISNSEIGFGTFILVDQAVIIDSKIGRFNIFKGPYKMFIDSGSSIGSSNIFNCNQWTLKDEFKKFKYQRSLKIGKNALISSKHYFDITGYFELGNNSWIAGRSSQFWTHGVGVLERDIAIGNDCYIGSATRFVPGSKISDSTLVGMGSVISRKFEEKYILVAGTPAKIIKHNFDWVKEKKKRIDNL